MDYLENITFDEIQVGVKAILTRTLTEKDIQLFAIMSGDINPAHVDIEYAQSDMFHKIIGHGMWGGTLISTVLGTQLPGPGTIYLSQTLKFKKPVGIGDTLTVTVTAIEKKPEKNRVVFSCECHNQHQELVMEGQAEVIAPTKKVRRPKAVLPEITLRRSYSLFDTYLAKAKQYSALVAGVIYPVHKLIITAIHATQQEGLLIPILIGPRVRIEQAAEEANIDISAYEIIDAEHMHAALSKAMQLVHQNKVGLLIRGGATREELLHFIQKQEKGLITDKYISHAALVDVPTYPKALILTDTLINIEPNLDAKRAITQNAIDFALAVGIEQPKVAILAGADMVSSGLRSTMDAAALCKMAERGQIRNGILDGPLTFDDVISVTAAENQGIQSPVIGAADILVMPNLETGSILIKQLQYLSEARSAGLTLGGRVPVLMDHIDDIYLSAVSCALAILDREFQQHKAHEKTKNQ